MRSFASANLGGIDGTVTTDRFVVIDKVHLVITGAHDVLVRGAACPAACGVKAALVRRVVAPPGRAGGDRLMRPVRAQKLWG